MLFMPIILNVFMITHSIDFGSGTPVITTLMLLGCFYLLLWDYKKWIILFQKDHQIQLNLAKDPEDKFMNDRLWVITGIIFLLLSSYPWIFKWKFFGAWIGCMLAVGTIAFVIGIRKWFVLKVNSKASAHPSVP
jgi:hypothetical protein